MSKSNLAAGSRCLAYHGPLLYEAKILRAYDPKTKTAKSKATQSEGAGEKEASTKDLPEELAEDTAYFVHYKGWKQTWDEWVEPSRVLAWNDDNIRKQKELKQDALATMQKSKTKSISTGTGSGDIVLAGNHSNSNNQGPNKRKDPSHKDDLQNDQPPTKTRGTNKRRSVAAGGSGTSNNGSSGGGGGGPADLDAEKEDDFLRRPEIEFEIPHILKAQLVDDWEKVTKNRKLVRLPSKMTVDDILVKYREASPKLSGVEAGIFDEVLSGLKLYFDRALGNILLYRFERQQYLELKKKHSNKNMSQVYGAEHLLRLMASMPGLIAQTHMDEQGVAHLREHLERFLRFLVKKKEEIFLDQYDDTSSRYEALSKGV